MKNWVIKSISIEHSDAEIIRMQGQGFNLSRFVRVCLRRHALHQEQLSMIHRQPGIQERLGVCLPQSACPVCWPEGTPTEANFAMFKGQDPSELNRARSLESSINNPVQPYTGPEVGDLDWLRSTISPAFNIAGIQAKGNAKPNSKSKSKSFIGKWLKKLRNDP